MTIAYAHSYYDPQEAALKYAARRMDADGIRVQLIEGHFDIMSPSVGHERVVALIRRRLYRRLIDLGLMDGSPNVDLPGSGNWYIPDIAVFSEKLAEEDSPSLTPDQLLLVVEVTSSSNAGTDRVLKRHHYGKHSAPLYLLVDREDRTWTLFSEPASDGYAAQHSGGFGEAVPLPEPFSTDLDTDGF
ncbi:MAG: Uma2 family endonuclease [Micromonosporaceae bacterium]